MTSIERVLIDDLFDFYSSGFYLDGSWIFCLDDVCHTTTSRAIVLLTNHKYKLRRSAIAQHKMSMKKEAVDTDDDTDKVKKILRRSSCKSLGRIEY